MKSATVYIQILFSIFLTGTSMVGGQGISSLLNQLFNSQAQNNKPLVLVLDKNNIQDEQKYTVKPNNLIGANLDRSLEEEVLQGVYLIQSQVQPVSSSQKRLPAINEIGNLGGLSGLSELYNLLANRPISKGHRGQLAEPEKKSSLSIQKLLRQSECDAEESCIEKCKKRFAGKKRNTCKTKCEVTFECPPMSDQDEDYDDPCEDADNDC